jgi:hypothetical protein
MVVGGAICRRGRRRRGGGIRRRILLVVVVSVVLGERDALRTGDGGAAVRTPPTMVGQIVIATVEATCVLI